MQDRHFQEHAQAKNVLLRLRNEKLLGKMPEAVQEALKSVVAHGEHYPSWAIQGARYKAEYEAGKLRQGRACRAERALAA